MNKKRKIVHQSGRPENDEDDEEGSGDYYGELYYSESDESYPTDYSDTTEIIPELIIEEAEYDKNIESQSTNNNKIDEIDFDDEYPGRRAGNKFEHDTDKNLQDFSQKQRPKTSGAGHSLLRLNVYSLVSIVALILFRL